MWSSSSYSLFQCWHNDQELKLSRTWLQVEHGSFIKLLASNYSCQVCCFNSWFLCHFILFMFIVSNGLYISYFCVSISCHFTCLIWFLGSSDFACSISLEPWFNLSSFVYYNFKHLYFFKLHWFFLYKGYFNFNMLSLKDKVVIKYCASWGNVLVYTWWTSPCFGFSLCNWCQLLLK